ncbi:MAG: hypothetical protein H6604_08960 [Flavobacteriales bacterium]|nr:hypothetical protein [Flavobacteriales bacterium]
MKANVFLTFSVFVVSVLIFSCNKDDNSGTVTYSVSQVNENDDVAIEKYLNEYYFDSAGNVKRIDDTEDVTEEENAEQLSNKLMNFAEKQDSGIWIVTREAVEADGDYVSFDNKNTTLQYNMFYFKSYKEDGTVYYRTPATSSTFSTILYGFKPRENPYFLDAPLYNDGDVKSDYEIEGILEGLAKFKATNNADYTNYNLQGVIVVPSRLAYGRDKHYVNPTSTSATKVETYEDYCFVFNFEVLKVENAE